MASLPEERAWARALAVRDEAAWERFAKEALPLVRAAVRRDLGAETLRTDLDRIVQDLSLRLLEDSGRRLMAFRGECRLTTWAAAIAVRMARAMQASERVRAERLA